jgi:hypothetical protein
MIILTDSNDKEYKLEFNRKTVANMESNGFVLNLDAPNTMIDALFYGAFQMYHKRIDREEVRKIWKEQRGKEKLLTALVKEYQKPLEDLMAEPEGDEENPAGSREPDDRRERRVCHRRDRIQQRGRRHVREVLRRGQPADARTGEGIRISADGADEGPGRNGQG